MQLKTIYNNIREWVISAYNGIKNYFKKLLVDAKDEEKQPEPDIHIIDVKVTGIKIKKKTN